VHLTLVCTEQHAASNHGNYRVGYSQSASDVPVVAAMGGAAGTLRHTNLPDAIDLHVGIKGESDSEWFKTTLTAKWLERSLLHLVVIPFLQTLQKERKSHAYTLHMLAGVEVGSMQLALDSGASGANHSIHSTVAEILSAMSEVSPPVHVTLAMHSDEEKAKPTFVRRMMSGLRLGGSGAHAFCVHLASQHSTTELSAKWQAKPAQDALVAPFLEHYNATVASEGASLRVADIVGLSIDGAALSGADALRAPPKDFAGARGTTTHVHLVVRDELKASFPSSATEGGPMTPSTDGVTRSHAAPMQGALTGAASASSSTAVGGRTRTSSDLDDNVLAKILDEIRFERHVRVDAPL
jgi:hypothetical protein